MEDELPKEFDLVVVGTGLTESIVAAAASRIGKSVLHLDSQDFYGGFSASFNLEALESYAKKTLDQAENVETILDSPSIKLLAENCQINDVDFKWFIPEKNNEEEDESQTQWTITKVKKLRSFNIDLNPTLLYGNGSMVKLLISSNICRYAEFRAVDRIATLIDGQIKNVPCSRSDVFKTDQVNVVEKRILMKLLESCMEFKDGNEEYESYKSKKFTQFLEEKRVPLKVRHYIINSLSMSNEETSFEEGVQNLNKFVDSLGRFGNTPFLFPMYGCGEIPQCFCRLCAVFGGIYCLQRRITSIECNNDALNLSLSSGNKLSSKSILFGPQTVKITPNNGEHIPRIVRGIFLTDKPLADDNQTPKGGGVEYMRLQSDQNDAHLLQLSHYSGCCPQNLYLFHFTTRSENSTLSPRDILTPFTEQIFTATAEIKILFEMFFTIPDLKNSYNVINGINICGGPNFDLDYDQSISEAKEMFQTLFKDEEFLPRAPEPEEIVMEGYDSTELAEQIEDVKLNEESEQIIKTEEEKTDNE